MKKTPTAKAADAKAADAEAEAVYAKAVDAKEAEAADAEAVEAEAADAEAVEAVEEEAVEAEAADAEAVEAVDEKSADAEAVEAEALSKAVDQVKKYIEYCMIHDMTKTETIDCIAKKCSINPILTQAVWERLEEENEEFMKAYYTRLELINQIVRFNTLLLNQDKMTNESNGSEVASNGYRSDESSTSDASSRI